MTHLYNKVLVTGSTGSLGFQITTALLDHGEKVVLLVRKESLENEKVQQLKQKGAEVAIGDLTNEEEITKALEGVDAIVAVHKGITHEHLLKAAKSKNVKRIISALWTTFLPNKVEKGLNMIADMHRGTYESLKDAGVPYTNVFNGVFYQYGFGSDFTGMSFKNDEFLLYGDGNQPIFTTSTFDIAKLTPYILNDESKINKDVHIAGAKTTQNEILKLYQKLKKNVVVIKIDEETVKKDALEAEGYVKLVKNVAWRAYFHDEGLLEPINEKDYPEVKCQSIEDFLKSL